MTPLTCKFTQLPGTISTNAAGETILVNSATGRFYGLSPSAGLLWEAFASPNTAGDAVDAVLCRLSGATDSAAQELSAFIAELRQEGLIIPAPAKSTGTPMLSWSHDLIPYAAPRLDRGTLLKAANGFSGTDDGHTTGLGGTKFS